MLLLIVRCCSAGARLRSASRAVLSHAYEAARRQDVVAKAAEALPGIDRNSVFRIQY